MSYRHKSVALKSHPCPHLKSHVNAEYRITTFVQEVATFVQEVATFVQYSALFEKYSPSFVQILSRIQAKVVAHHLLPALRATLGATLGAT